MTMAANKTRDAPLQTSTQQDFEKDITLSGSADSSNKAQGRTRILRASEVLLSLAGRRSMNGTSSSIIPEFDVVEY